MRAVRKVLRLDEIAPAQLRRIELNLARRLFHQPFHQEVGLRPSCPSIRAGRHRVREHRADAVVHERHVIHRGLHLRAKLQRNDRGGADGHGADVPQGFHLHGQNSSIDIERKARLVVLVAAHMRREEILTAIGPPLHRTAELARGVADERILRHEAGLHAEAAADVADHDAELIRLGAEHGPQ